MQLEAFNACYSIQEDRILLQATGDGDSQSYWITRRAALMLGEGIYNVLTDQQRNFSNLVVASEHIPDVLAFNHSTSTKSNPPKPGTIKQDAQETPILLFQISYSVEDAKYCRVTLTDEQGRGYGYRLNTDMLHALINLVQTQCDQADWSIRLNQKTIVTSAPSSPSELH